MFEVFCKYSLEDFARSELVYLGDWPSYVPWLLTAVAAVGIATLLYYRRGRARWYQLCAIGALQAGMVGVVIWALLQPSLATDRLREGENTVALVLDTSGSMAYGAPQSRFDDARRHLAGVMQQGELARLSTRHYELAASARAVDSFVDSSPEGAATSIAESLAAILDEARFRPLAAVVLSSDGADTSGGLGTDDLTRIAAFGVPVHTIGVGQTRIPQDIELADVTVPATALPGSTVSARVGIRHDAAASTRIKVYDGDDLLQIVPLELGADTGMTTAWIDVGLTEAGPHQLSFSVEGGADESELRNNSRTRLVNVSDQRYRVLYFEGEPRWEYKFLRRAVGGDEDLQIASLLRVSPNKFYRQGIDSAEQLEDGFPDSRDELFAYDALIIGSVEAASLSDEQQQLIRDFVSERGGSLLMFAGPHGLGNGGWGQSAIGDVLPVRLPPATHDTFHRKKTPVSLTPQGADSRVLRFDSDAEMNREAWLGLPEVADYQLTGSLKPAAVTLLNADTDLGQIPLLITQPFGRGHAWILATGGTWRWQMSMPLEDQKHEIFWRQLLRELVASAPEPTSLSVSGSGEESVIALRAEFRDDAFRPIDDVGVSAVASHESGETLSLALRPGDEAGVFTAELEPPLSGTWYFEALAERNGEPVALSRSSILVESGRAEHFNFRANPGLLQRLSEATGGRYFAAGDLSGLADQLRYSSSGITETEHRPIWDAPAVFILLVLLKAGEWLLRRRWSSI